MMRRSIQFKNQNKINFQFSFTQCNYTFVHFFINYKFQVNYTKPYRNMSSYAFLCLLSCALKQKTVEEFLR